MKPSPLSMLAAFVLFLLAGCGGGSEGGAEASDAGDSAAMEDAPIDPGTNTDLEEFLDEYEEYVEQYCEFTEKFATATMAEMAAMMEDMSAKAMELADFSARAITLKASASQEAQDRLDKMGERAEECGEAFLR